MTCSVALCTCNGARYLPDQLASIAAQSRPIDELVVCDDDSTDATAQIVADFAATAPFSVRWHIHRPALGTTHNFQRAISLCGGGIIFLADQDDLWEANKVEVLAGELEAHESCALVFSNGAVVDERLSPRGYDLWKALWFTRGEQRRVMRSQALDVFIKHTVAAGTTMAFRAAHRALLVPFPSMPSVHDAWCAALLACVGHVRLIPHPLIRYRLHQNNQIGLRRWNLPGQLAQARRQVNRGAFAQEAEFFQALLERLSRHNIPLDDRRRRLLEDKICHATFRDQLHKRGVSRPLSWPRIVAAAARGDYHRYAYGAKSVLQDLFL